MPTGLLAIILGAALAATLLSACGSGSEEGSAQYSDSTESPLLEFGREASAEELDAAAESVEAFLDKRAASDYAAACRLVAEQMLDRLERLAKNSTSLKDTSCAAFLEAYLRLPPEERRESTEIDPGSLRRKGAEAYLLYTGADDDVFAMPLREEGGEWKVTVLVPQEIS